MILDLSARDGPALKQRWRQQAASQQRRRLLHGPRPLAAIAILQRGPEREGLVDIRHLIFTVVYDLMQCDGSLTTRCAGYKAAVVPWGLKIGGADTCRFDKDLCRALGRMSVGSISIQRMRGCSKWRSTWIDTLRGTATTNIFRELGSRAGRRFGPAFNQGLSTRFDVPARSSKHRCGAATTRTINCEPRFVSGMAIFPLEYVSHHWERITAILVNLKTFPKRQLIALEPHARNLRGYDGAIEFDLLSSRFSPVFGRRCATSRKRTTAMLAS